jgi:hypothetical protein
VRQSASPNLQCIFEMLVDFHNGGLISTTIAVVGRTKYRHNVMILAPVVTL